MTTITITGVGLTKNGISKLKRDLGRTSVLSSRMGRALRDDARRRITTQGDGTWEPLGKWAKARTGRRKVLITERKNITFRLIGGQLVIGHQSSGTWSLDDHARGFTTRPKVPALIPLKRPKLLGLPSDQKTHLLRRAKPSVVPARRVFPTEPEASQILKPIVGRWVAEIIKRSRNVA